MKASNYPHTLASVPDGSAAAACAPEQGDAIRTATAFARALASKHAAAHERGEHSFSLPPAFDAPTPQMLHRDDQTDERPEQEALPRLIWQDVRHEDGEPKPIDAACRDANGAPDSSRETQHGPIGGDTLANVRRSTLPEEPRRGTLSQDVPDYDRYRPSRVPRRGRTYAASHATPGHDCDGRQQHVDSTAHAPELQNGRAWMPQVLHSLCDPVEQALVEQSPSIRGSLEIALPLHPVLLPDTRATLCISATELLVRFETRHASVARLLSRNADALADRLARRTAKVARVEITSSRLPIA